MKQLLKLLLLLAIFANGCDSDTSPDNTTPSTLIPLKEGNYWVYERSLYDSAETLLARSYDTITIGKPVTIDGQVWYEKLRSGLNIPIDSASYSNQPDGVWERYVLSVGAFTNLLYKYPTVANDTFALIRRASFPPDETFERTFKMTVATNTQITVPAGSFSAIHYRDFMQSVDSVTMEVKRSPMVVDEYVAPGVGLVMSNSQSLFITRTVLIRYSLK